MNPPLLALSALLALLASGCSIFDPTAGMNEQEKQAYYAEQAAKKEQRRAAKAEYDSKNVKNLSVPGEGHDEARDAKVTGTYECKMTLPVGEHNFLFKKEDATYKKHKRAQFFANGSFVEQTLIDAYQSTDGKSSMGITEETWTRGMWKTSGKDIYTRPLKLGGFGPWQKHGEYQVGSAGGKKVLAVGKNLDGIEGLFARRDDEGKVNDPRQFDLWVAK
jgi:hypothetical protein